MNAVAVLSASGKKLMPTTSYRARKLLKSKRAVIYKYRPIFTIRLTDREEGDTQPIEYCCDTGYGHIGISIKSRKHEYVSEQRDLLPDEPEKHNDQRKQRRARRSRLRYRRPRFDNRKGMICKDGFAPSIRNKRDRHILLFQKYSEVLPVTSAVFEMGQFDTQVLKAMEEGRPLPEGADYQYGDRYGTATLREAVFTRDNYTCICCAKNAFKDKVILHIHHVGFWKNDRTNRMANLGTVCDRCHTPKSHKPEGKLWGLEPRLKTFKGATFMTMVRWDMLKKLKEAVPDVEVHITYGAATKEARHDLGIPKSHANDAYAMGIFHPRHRADFKQWQKVRRNNRVLEKFYDAKYIDTRDRKVKSGSQLSCNRTNRREPRNSPKNERIYRGEKVSKGYRQIRRSRYELRPGMRVRYKRHFYMVKGMQNKGAYIQLIKGTETRAFAELESARKDKTIVAGYMAKDLTAARTPKRKVVSANEQNQTAEIEILFSVRPSLVKPVAAITGGWKLVG